MFPSYTWNRAGALTSEKYPSNRVVTTGYDGANRPNSLASGATTYLSGLAYAPHGAPASYLYNNNLMNRTQSFNNRLQPTDMRDWPTSAGSNGFLLDLGYTYGGGTSVTVYLNGQSQTGSLSSAIPLNTALTGSRQSAIGSATAPGYFYFPGLIDDVRIYSRVLSAAEIQALYNAGK